MRLLARRACTSESRIRGGPVRRAVANPNARSFQKIAPGRWTRGGRGHSFSSLRWLSSTPMQSCMATRDRIRPFGLVREQNSAPGRCLRRAPPPPLHSTCTAPTVMPPNDLRRCGTAAGRGQARSPGSDQSLVSHRLHHSDGRTDGRCIQVQQGAPDPAGPRGLVREVREAGGKA